MTWRSVAYLDSMYAGALDVAREDDMLAFRTLGEITGWYTGDLSTPRWTYTLDDDAPMGGKSVVGASGAFVTYNDPMVDESLSNVVAYEPRSGAWRWGRSLPLVVSQGGLVSCQDAIFLHGYEPEKERYSLLRLDPKTGEEQFSLPSEDIRVIRCTGEALLLVDGDGVSAYSYEGLMQSRIDGASPSLASNNGDVYASFQAGGVPRFVWWEGVASSARERANCVVPQVPGVGALGAFIVALPDRGCVAYAPYREGAGLWGISIAEGDVLWHAALDGSTKVSSIVGTPHGPIATVTGNGPALLHVSPHNGQVGQVATRLVVVTAVFWLVDHLVVTGLDEAELFTWER